MTDHRSKTFQTPDSVLADYFQELLAPVAADEPRARSPRQPGSASGITGDRLPAGPATPARAKPSRPAPAWAEPPVLDPKVFTPPLQRAPAEPAAQLDEHAPPAPVETKVATIESDESVVAQTTQLPERPLQADPMPTAQAPVEEGVGKRWIHGRPEWAQDPFDCLLFSVSGLKLAVPLVLLGAVHPLDRDLTPLVGRPKWFMGLLARGERNTRVVDTAQWVMPDRYRADARASYGFVIRLDDSEWGLACDEVAQSFRLKPDEVKWRSEDSRRPWLAGTVKSQMCALLDVGAFARMLARAEKTQQFDLES